MMKIETWMRWGMVIGIMGIGGILHAAPPARNNGTGVSSRGFLGQSSAPSKTTTFTLKIPTTPRVIFPVGEGCGHEIF